MSCGGVTEAGKNPWNTRGVIAMASLAVITLLAGSILAILHTQGIALPSALTLTNCLIGGVVGGVFFSILSLVIRYCCCCEQQKKQNGGGDGATTTEETKANTPLDPNGNKGKVGAPGGGGGSNSTVKTGGRKDLLN
jgi:hypothetical protein